MPQSTIRWRADSKIFLANPTDYTDLNDPKPISASSVPPYTFIGLPAVVRLFDVSKRTRTIIDVVTGESILPVDSANGFNVGDNVEIYVTDTQNGGEIRKEEIVTAVDTLDDTITITNAIGIDELLTAGSTVQAQLGPEVALAEILSAPAAIDTDLQADPWGWEGTIEWNHAGLFPGMLVRVECRFYTDQDINDYPILQEVPVLEQSS